jgi:hypothetical protein
LVVEQLTGLLLASSMVKVAVPVGVPEPGLLAATDAVKVTLWPVTDGLSDDSTDVVVESLFTVTDRSGEVEDVR